MSNITCYDSDNNLLKTLYQWDNGQVLTVKGVDMPPAPVFHFCNRRSKTALVVSPEVSGSDLKVKVPNVLLREAEPITAYLYRDTSNDGYRTMWVIKIPVVPRPRPDDYEYKEDNDYISIAVLNAKVNELSEKVAAASASVVELSEKLDENTSAVETLRGELAPLKEELDHYIDVKAVDGLRYENSQLYLTSDGQPVSDPVKIVSGGTQEPVDIATLDEVKGYIGIGGA